MGSTIVSRLCAKGYRYYGRSSSESNNLDKYQLQGMAHPRLNSERKIEMPMQVGFSLLS